MKTCGSSLAVASSVFLCYLFLVCCSISIRRTDGPFGIAVVYNVDVVGETQSRRVMLGSRLQLLTPYVLVSQFHMEV